MKKIAVLAALMVALCFASEAKAFHPGVGAGFGIHRANVIRGGLGVNRGLFLGRSAFVGNSFFRTPVIVNRGFGVGYGALGVNRGIGLGCGQGIMQDAGVYGAGLNSCAPIGNVVSPGLSLRLRIN